MSSRAVTAPEAPLDLTESRNPQVILNTAIARRLSGERRAKPGAEGPARTNQRHMSLSVNDAVSERFRGFVSAIATSPGIAQPLSLTKSSVINQKQCHPRLS